MVYFVNFKQELHNEISTKSCIKKKSIRLHIFEYVVFYLFEGLKLVLILKFILIF